MRVNLSFVGPQAENRTGVISAQKTVNWYPTVESRGSKTVTALQPCPGLKALVSVGPGPCRGNGVVFRDKAYFVSGDKLVSIDSNDVGTVIGTLGTSAGYVSMTAGFSQLCLVDGVEGYTYDGSTFAKITDADFPVADYVEWIDNYFIVNSSGTGKFYISALDDATTWAALDFATAEKRADDLVRPLWYLGQLLLLGTETGELYYNSGNADFPWEAYPTSVFEYGIAAPASAALAANTLFMLAKSKVGGYTVIKVEAAKPRMISDISLNWQINQMSTISDAIGFVYEQWGHRFYQLTFPTANKTFVYDDTTGLWHERQTGTNRHQAYGHVYSNGKHIVGDRASSQFYTLDSDTFSDNTVTTHRIRRAPVVHKDRKWLSHNRLEVEFKSGVGLTAGQGVDPQVMLRWSDDGAETWGSEAWRPLGKIGKYNMRSVWYGLGTSRERIYEIHITDPIDAVMIGATLDVRVGLN